jgi:hypothetical protein
MTAVTGRSPRCRWRGRGTPGRGLDGVSGSMTIQPSSPAMKVMFEMS